MNFSMDLADKITAHVRETEINKTQRKEIGIAILSGTIISLCFFMVVSAVSFFILINL